MRNFNADDYEPVEARISRFLKEHKEGRILTVLVSDPNNMDYAVFRAEIYDNGNLLATGWSQAIRDKELKLNKYGKEYESVNYTSWLENSETSAIGRGLANCGYQGSKRASREEMQKAAERYQTGEEQQEKKPSAEAEFLRDDLLAYLATSENIVGKANADKLREAMKKHEGDEAWLKQALDRTIAEVKRQETILAANTAPENPMAEKVAKLQAAASATGRTAGEATQGGLSL